jgi:glycine/D-amino acid oxidase-like deaminating enzyme
MRRVIVVGGGVVGLLTAVECVLAGAEVTIVDQADLPYARATSYDWHRIFRALHPNNLPATRAALAAQRRWAELEQLLATRFYHRIGALTVRRPEELASDLDLLSAAGVPVHSLCSEELAGRYAHIRVPAGRAAIVETDAGVVLADRALAALVDWLRCQRGVRFFLRRRVVDVDAEAGAVRLADTTVLQGDRIVVTAGPWSRDLMPIEEAAGLALYRQSMLYCSVPERLREVWAATPAIPVLGTAEGAWLVPPVAATPLKLSAHSACRAVAELTDHRTPVQWRDHLIALSSDLLTGFQASWVIDSRDCYYLAETATGGPLLISLGGGTVWVYAACGGSSFKFAPLIARSLAGRALGTDPTPTGLDALDHPRRWAAMATTLVKVTRQYDLSNVFRQHQSTPLLPRVEER